MYELSKVNMSTSQEGDSEFSMQLGASRLGGGVGGTASMTIGESKDARIIPPTSPHSIVESWRSSDEQFGTSVMFPVALKMMLSDILAVSKA
jgi:hypothetical protein